MKMTDLSIVQTGETKIHNPKDRVHPAYEEVQRLTVQCEGLAEQVKEHQTKLQSMIEKRATLDQNIDILREDINRTVETRKSLLEAVVTLDGISRDVDTKAPMPRKKKVAK